MKKSSTLRASDIWDVERFAPEDVTESSTYDDLIWNLNTLARRIMYAPPNVHTRIVEEVADIIDSLDNMSFTIEELTERVYFKNILSPEEIVEIYSVRDSDEGEIIREHLEFGEVGESN